MYNKTPGNLTNPWFNKFVRKIILRFCKMKQMTTTTKTTTTTTTNPSCYWTRVVFLEWLVPHLLIPVLFLHNLDGECWECTERARTAEEKQWGTVVQIPPACQSLFRLAWTEIVKRHVFYYFIFIYFLFAHVEPNRIECVARSIWQNPRVFHLRQKSNQE